jgi:hypothetical protein
LLSKRWATEIFHRTIKSNLGLEDLGAHIHWVYCSYILLHDLVEDDNIGIKGKQNILEAKIKIKNVKMIIKKTLANK